MNDVGNAHLHPLPVALLGEEGEERTQQLAGLLHDTGFSVLRARSGQEVLERARATDPAVIVIAADLPDMTGLDLCRALRDTSTSRHEALIFLGLDQATPPAQRLAALRAGASECLALPLDAEEAALKADAFIGARRDVERARADGLLDTSTGLYNRQGLARRARELGSQAYRDHGPLACVVLVFDVPADEPGDGHERAGPVSRGVRALLSTARRSDVIGRLGPVEFAVLAPKTGASGARRLAERLATTVQEALPASGARADRSGCVRCGYEAVDNVGYTPIEPVDLLVRAAAAVRTDPRGARRP